MPDDKRRAMLGYERALARLKQGICLFGQCHGCSERRSSFNRYCFSCGAPAPGAAAD